MKQLTLKDARGKLVTAEKNYETAITKTPLRTKAAIEDHHLKCKKALEVKRFYRDAIHKLIRGGKVDDIHDLPVDKSGNSRQRKREVSPKTKSKESRK